MRGTHQIVGNIDGSCTTQINAGSDFAANHIVQIAVVIGGTAGSPALVKIDASDSSGNPLGKSSGLSVAASSQPTAPFASGAPSSSILDLPSAEGLSGDPIPAGPGADGIGAGGNCLALPEPWTLLLALFALCGGATMARGRVARASGPHPYAVWQVNCILRQTAVMHQSEIKNL